MKYVKLLTIITLTLLLASGVFVWVSHVGEVATLSYVPDRDWSKRHIILPYVEAETYDAAVDSRRNVHLIWLEYDPDHHIVSVKHTAVNSKGKSVVAPHVVLDAPDIQKISLTMLQDSLRIIWTGKDGGEKADINYLELSRNGDILAQKKVFTHMLTDAQSLQVISGADGTLFAVWSDTIENQVKIQTLVMDTNGNAKGQPETMPFAGDALYPRLAADQTGRVHMTWQNETEYSYGLYYLPLTADGRPAAESIFVDETDLNSVTMAASDQKLFLSWNRVLPREYRREDSIVEKAFPNYAVFGTTVDLAHPAQIDGVVNLTDELGPAFDQHLALDEKGRVNIVYADTNYDTLQLTQQTFGRDFTDVKKVSRRLYPDQRIAMQTRLLSDPVKGLHLIWMQSDMYSGAVFYANTIHRQWISPLQIIGLNGDNHLVSVVMSLGYVLGISFYSLLIHLHLLILAILGAFLAGLGYLFRKRTWGAWFGNRFAVPAILCAVTCVLYLLVGGRFGIGNWMVWPKFYDPHQIWFIALFATAATVYYIIKGKIRSNDFLKLTIAAMFWFYWMHLINFIFNLPVVNFS